MAKYIVQHRRGTAEQWAAKDTAIPFEGEIVIELDKEKRQHKLKIGDGDTAYADLAYLTAGGDDVIQQLDEIKPRVVTVTLDKNKWEKVESETNPNLYYQEPDISPVNVLITSQSRLDLQPSVEMLAEFQQLSAVFVTENENGKITVYSVGDKPSNSYIMQATLIETKLEVEQCDKVVSIPVGTPTTNSDWNQTDETKADYIKNKPDIATLVVENTTYTNSDPLLQNVGGILANNHPEGFDNVPINDLLTELLYPYTKPSIGTLSLTPTAGIKKKNVGFDVTKASITVTKKSKSIQSVALYRGDTELQSKTDGVAAGGTFSFVLSDESLTGATNTSYKIKVTEAGEGGKTYESDTAGYTFVYPFYYGVISKDATVDSATILGFEESIINKQNHSHSYTTNNECPVIAYPKGYGVLKSIIDPNNFTQEWTRSDVVVNKDEIIPNIDYYVYVGGAATATNTTYKFNYS